MYKYLSSNPKTVKVFKNKESVRNYHNQEEPKEIWLLNVMWYPRRGARTEKGHHTKLKSSE